MKLYICYCTYLYYLLNKSQTQLLPNPRKQQFKSHSASQLLKVSVAGCFVVPNGTLLKIRASFTLHGSGDHHPALSATYARVIAHGFVYGLLAERLPGFTYTRRGCSGVGFR